MAATRRTPQRRNEIHEVWIAVDDLRATTGAIQAELASVHAQMQSIAEAVKTLAQSQQPKWGVAVAGVALVVTVCGGMAGTALAPLFLSDAHMSQMFNEHTHLDGHPNALQLHAATEKDVHRLDERTSTLLKKVDDFDARLRDVERQTQ